MCWTKPVRNCTASHAVFLPGEELWDQGFRRLTMTFDPGRIKRGLTSNEAIGPPLAEGKHYTLVIDRRLAGCARRAYARRLPKDISRRTGQPGSAGPQTVDRNRAENRNERRARGGLSAPR